MCDLLDQVYKQKNKDKHTKKHDFDFSSLIGEEIVIKKQVTLYVNEVVCMHTFQSHMVEFLDVTHNKEHKEIQKEQIKKGFGHSPINFKGVSPIIWLSTWTGISMKDFQNRRNYLYN
jgi:hypothetical protein